MSTNNGGPAFPIALGLTTDLPDGQQRITRKVNVNEGMTLRDWFAGQALAGLVANDHHYAGSTIHQTAAEAYDFADAMLAQREKRAAK